MKVLVITDEQLIEGVVGALFFPLLIIFFRYTEGLLFVSSSILAFILTWIARKIAINNYTQYKRKYNYKPYMFSFTI